MPRVVQSGEFFVVGGPVQPDRPCYIERAADGVLRQGLADRRFCYVLGPKASGKTSLMARTIRGLRADNQLAAVVDLTQLGARGENAEAGRWYYSIAYRIVRELRLRVDLQTWWQEKSVLVSEQRLADFFWEIVLTNTTAPVSIFFDEIERAIELPFSRELFVALSACYDGRATEPDYQRLNFAIMGVATPRQLGHGLTLPLFEGGLAIEPSDFTLEETYRLAEGFESEDQATRAALNRIYHWVKGQPYLTQKIARAVARRRGSAEDVDSVVRGQFLGESAREDEPLLNHTATLLTQRSPQYRRALALLGHLARGAPIVVDAESRSQELLALAGITTTADDEFLTYRSRLMKAVFTSRWVKSSLPFN
ncbi:MAG TPA: AAA-like domain-containing protein, partial [Gammaproteobacteria bacterium]|nr:AAA-like domain-containing protein [Gammaproteobacteria bacterium]